MGLTLPVVTPTQPPPCQGEELTNFFLPLLLSLSHIFMRI